MLVCLLAPSATDLSCPLLYKCWLVWPLGQYVLTPREVNIVLFVLCKLTCSPASTYAHKPHNPYIMPYQPRTTPTTEDYDYEVEEILDIQGHGGSSRYLIKWVGYDEPSWTWAKHANCRELVRRYHNKKRNQRRYEARRLAGRPTRRPPASKREPKLKVVGADMPQEEAKENERVCVCCQTNKPTHMVQPCNHGILCSMCAVPVSSLHGCPKCRGPIERIAPFYLD